uniref:CD44 antigen n=1 Tax=Pelusios castaneus TaxID=367368 RepID=A0A8C8RZN6_9SAUR
MSKFLLCATFGLYLLQLCVAETQFNISCRYAGVFHVEKNRRYSLTRPEAVELCRALNSTLPTMEQMKKAHSLGFETCRYGYIESAIVVPRINPYHLCAANITGVYILSSNITERYDTYCYNASETREKACEPIIRLDASLSDNGTQIVIDNADGSRYTQVVGTEPTPPKDAVNTDIDLPYDSSIMNSTIIMPDAPYTKDETQDYSGSGSVRHTTSTNVGDEYSDVIPLTTDGVPGKESDLSKGQHPTSTSKVYEL